MQQILIGEVLGIENKELHVITFKIDGYIDKSIAYPLGVVDEPVVGDEIVLFELDPIFKSAYFYFKKKVDEDIAFNYKGKSIKILDKTIEIKTPKANIIMNDNGLIEISNDKTSLKKIIKGFIMTYMKTKTIDGKPLDPESIKSATENLKDTLKLLK